MGAMRGHFRGSAPTVHGLCVSGLSFFWGWTDGVIIMWRTPGRCGPQFILGGGARLVLDNWERRSEWWAATRSVLFLLDRKKSQQQPGRLRTFLWLITYKRLIYEGRRREAGRNSNGRKVCFLKAVVPGGSSTGCCWAGRQKKIGTSPLPGSFRNSGGEKKEERFDAWIRVGDYGGGGLVFGWCFDEP